MNVCVVALGKIGLPLAVQIATKGHRVTGVDVNAETVDLVNRGVVPFPGEAQLDEKLRQVLADGLLQATTDTTAAVGMSEAVIVVVPLIVDDEAKPDFRGLDAATRDIAAGLKSGTLVSYETTLPVGTTRGRFAPALAAGSRLVCGEDLFVVFSPERVSSGRIFADLRKYPKLVGGVDDESTKRGIACYESILDFDERPDLDRPNGVWDMGSADASEFAKVAETTYRDVNIALANEFARFADRVGIDVQRVIDASNSQPFSHIHRPGIAVGGHCIPVYPHFYLATDPTAALPAAGRRVNDDMPRYAVERLASHVDEGIAGKRVAVLGVCYRGGVKETAFSGVFGVVAELCRQRAVVVVEDPLHTDDELRALGFEPYHIGEPCDAVIVQADHVEYRQLAPADLPGVVAGLDGRNCVAPEAWLAAGVPLLVVGKG